MTSRNFKKEILQFISNQKQGRLKPRKLARDMGVSEEEYGSFRQAYKQLRDRGHLLLGAPGQATIVQSKNMVIGRFHVSPRGFGFVIPDEPDARGDLYVPAENAGGAMHGDRVAARRISRGKRGGRMQFAGEIMEVIERGTSTFVGTIERSQETCFVVPDGKHFTVPIVLVDPPEASVAPSGTKVTVDIVEFAEAGDLPTGKVDKILGEAGIAKTEAASAVALFSLPHVFPKPVLSDAKSTEQAFEPILEGPRIDLSNELTITIDPKTAKDFDDAISLKRPDSQTYCLGVHIADVSSFIKPGSSLDEEAYKRGTSVYFPRTVIPMLPEQISNGVCSLSPGELKYTLTAEIVYDKEGHRLESRVFPSMIRSDERLNYEQAEEIALNQPVELKSPHAKEVKQMIKDLTRLAKKIDKRRKKEGMLNLDMPELELEFDETGRVIDADRKISIYSHKVIEMFMVEANEAVATQLEEAGTTFIKRIHPEPSEDSLGDLSTFVRACGEDLKDKPGRQDIKRLLRRVNGKTTQYAINLSVLRSLERAVYTTQTDGHFALASGLYCHFTSPIRRYADLMVHREVWDKLVYDKAPTKDPEIVGAIEETATQCNITSRRAENAERHVIQSLVLAKLKTQIGTDFEGIISGVTDFGLFVQHPKYLVEGLVRFDDLGDDWYEVIPDRGEVRGKASGDSFRIGQTLQVQIASVDISKLMLDLTLPLDSRPKPSVRPERKSSKQRPKKQKRGRRNQS